MTTFDLSDLDAADEAQMEVLSGGKPTGWMWTFAGPGHPKAAEQNARVSREQLQRNRMKEQAQVNGKKWKAAEQTPDELLNDNANFVMERLLGWSEITLNGEPFPFTRENAFKILTDRKKPGLLQQSVEFILEDNSFTKRSAAT